MTFIPQTSMASQLFPKTWLVSDHCDILYSTVTQLFQFPKEQWMETFSCGVRHGCITSLCQKFVAITDTYVGDTQVDCLTLDSQSKEEQVRLFKEQHVVSTFKYPSVDEYFLKFCLSSGACARRRIFARKVNRSLQIRTPCSREHPMARSSSTTLPHTDSAFKKVLTLLRSGKRCKKMKLTCLCVFKRVWRA